MLPPGILNDLAVAPAARERQAIGRAVQYAFEHRWISSERRVAAEWVLRASASVNGGLPLESAVQSLRPAHGGGYSLFPAEDGRFTASVEGTPFTANSECLALAGAFLKVLAESAA